jgi:hypothetical protein
MKTPTDTFVEALQEAHTDLLSDLHELEKEMGADSASPVALGTHLGSLQTHILEHFRFEEEGGYMAQVLKEEPQLRSAADELLEEHQQMAETLEGLIQEITKASGVRDAFRKKVKAWIKQIRQHESRENSLVQEAYYDSGATGD